MGMAVGGKHGGVQSEMNVTPLIDVCLVLLIIFMVVTPMLQRGKPVQLPKTPEPIKKPESDKAIVVSVADDGSIYLGHDLIPDKDFIDQMREQNDREPGKPLVLMGDRRVSYGVILKVMRMLNDAGYHGVGLISEKEKKEG